MSAGDGQFVDRDAAVFQLYGIGRGELTVAVGGDMASGFIVVDRVRENGRLVRID